ncbi:MAG TPA: polysaccharide deacetylase family protein [Candidatus Sulfotelmatobacter sp.]|nr:polysaccharide deacetylase family protein [Candidatus Sulfotelmatobacter sp.]
MTASEKVRKVLRRSSLRVLKSCGAFRLVESTQWRRERLLILCYHGISLQDEHEWRPFYYIRPQLLERRLQILKDGNFSVLPLAEALERLSRRDLPPKSVAITFDDGTYDFYAQAFPRLRKLGFPVTVYLTSYYSNLQCPVFSLICSYMLWKARDKGTSILEGLGASRPVNLASAEDRQRAVEEIVASADRKNLSGIQKNEIASRLAELIDVDYGQIVKSRVLQVMRAQEVKELAQAGVDFQLHTHRHRMPPNENLFRKEIRDNRDYLSQYAARDTKHFCYPSGAYRPEYLDWLSAEGIISATTCDTGLATVESNRLLLPRLLDTTGRTDLEFESWANGIGHFLSSGRRARLAYSPD